MSASRTPASRSIRIVACADSARPRMAYSVSRISSTSPTVTSASMPPLAATITADRNRMSPTASGVIAAFLLAQSTELVEARAVAPVDHVADQLAFLAGGQQPCQRRSHHIRADHDQQRAGHKPQPALGVLSLAAKPLLGMLRPVRAGGVSAAGHPPLLPGLAGLAGEPVQQQRHAPAAGFPHPLRRQLGGRGGDDPIHFRTIGACSRPVCARPHGRDSEFANPVGRTLI